MLCEGVLHVLVEEGVLSKAKAIEAIETVAELTREMADGNPYRRGDGGRAASLASALSLGSLNAFVQAR